MRNRIPLVSVGGSPGSSRPQGNQEERPRHPPKGARVRAPGSGNGQSAFDLSAPNK
jgi:hypothetical protein